jgi:hypothetical protein
MVRPTASVITGTVPHLRFQSFFRTSEPIVSGELVRSLNVRLHKLYGGDPSVVNPSRLMRLPGTIAWPWKQSGIRVPELTKFIRPPENDPRPANYPINLLTSQLPEIEQRQDVQRQDQPFDFGTPATFGELTTVGALIAAIKAGREWHKNMIRLVAHWIANGRSSAEILGHAEGWTLPGYTFDQTRREVAKAIEGARLKWNVPEIDPALNPAAAPQPIKILSLADLDALPPPQWLVHGLIPEKSLVVPYGPPKAGKTFIVLSLALHIAADMPWFGHSVQGGAVVYVAGEGVGGLSMRIKAMRARHDIPIDVPFWVIPRAVNFRTDAEVVALEAVIRQTIGGTPLRFLVIDTLARAMPGADENSAQEVGSVISAADRLKENLGCTVSLVHHEGKDGDRGARGTSALRGAWDASYRITSTGRQTTLTVMDQKEAEGGQVLRFNMEDVQVSLGRGSLVPILDTESGDDDDHRASVGGQAGMALDALRNLLAGPDGALLPPLSGLPSDNTRGVSHEIWRRAFYDRMPGEDQEKRKLAFWRASQKLQQMKLVGMKDPWVWIV